MKQNSIAAALLRFVNQVSELENKIRLLEEEIKMLQPLSEYDKMPDILTPEDVKNYLRFKSMASVYELFKIPVEKGGLKGFLAVDGGRDKRCLKEDLKAYVLKQVERGCA